LSIHGNRWVVLLLVIFFTLGAVAVASESSSAADDAEAEEGEENSKHTEYVEVNSANLPTSNTVATKLPVPLRLTPANVGTVGPELIHEQGAALLGDALRNVSGVNVQTGSGVTDYYLVRGFDSQNGTLLMLDGVAEPESSSYPMYNVAGIEVLKGPAGFLYGKDPLAGVVNIVRKQPLPTDFGLLSASYGSFATSEVALDWNEASESGDVAFRINTLWNESENYRDAKDSQHIAINPSLSLKAGEKTKLNFNFEYVDAEYSPDDGIPLVNGEIPDVSRRQSYQSPFDSSEQIVTRAQFDVETTLSDSVTLRNTLYYRELEWESQGSLFFGPTFDLGFGPLALRGLTTLDSKQQFIGNQFEAVYTAQTGSVSHSLLGGIEIARLSDDSTGMLAGNMPCDPSNPFSPPCLPPIAVFDPVEFATEPTQFAPLIDNDLEVDILAPYAVYHAGFGEKFHLMLGARFDNIDLKGSLFAASMGQTVTVSRDDSELSPMLGFVYAPNESVSLYFNAAESHAPSALRPSDFVDPDTLQPEDSEGYELGVKTQAVRGKLQTTFALYQIDRSNFAIPDNNGITQQAGDQRSRGVELELGAEPVPGLHTFVSYAYNESEFTNFGEFGTMGFIDRTGNVPAYAPEHLLNVWVSRKFSNGVNVAAGASYASKQFIDEDNVYEIDGYVVVDAHISYDFKRYRFKLALNNLLDEEYEVRTLGPYSVLPAAGLSARAGFEFRY